MHELKAKEYKRFETIKHVREDDYEFADDFYYEFLVENWRGFCEQYLFDRNQSAVAETKMVSGVCSRVRSG